MHMRGGVRRLPRIDAARRMIESKVKEGSGMFAHKTRTRAWRIGCLTVVVMAWVGLQAASAVTPAKPKQAAPATKSGTKAPSVAPRSAGADLTLTSSTCATGTQLVVSIDLSNSSSTIVGVQFFLHYN